MLNNEHEHFMKKANDFQTKAYNLASPYGFHVGRIGKEVGLIRGAEVYRCSTIEEIEKIICK